MSVVNFAEVCSAISVRIGADAAAKRLHAGRASRVGRRPAAAYAPDRQIVDYVTAPLRGAAPRPAGTA